MIQIVDSPGIIQCKILMENGSEHAFNDNKEFAINVLIDCINVLFPNLNKVQIEAFVLNLFNHCQSWTQFKETLRDMLISMKSYSSNNDEFYEEERKVSVILLCE
jgi:CRM1 C terminal